MSLARAWKACAASWRGCAQFRLFAFEAACSQRDEMAAGVRSLTDECARLTRVNLDAKRAARARLDAAQVALREACGPLGSRTWASPTVASGTGRRDPAARRSGPNRNGAGDGRCPSPPQAQRRPRPGCHRRRRERRDEGRAGEDRVGAQVLRMLSAGLPLQLPRSRRPDATEGDAVKIHIREPR